MPPCTGERAGGFAGGRRSDPDPEGETRPRPDRTWDMISRSTLIGALVVVELAILGLAAKAVPGNSPNTNWNFDPSWTHQPAPTTSRLDKTFETGSAPHVVLDVDNADVTVQAGAATSVHVTGTMKVSGHHSGVQPALTAIRTADGVRVAVESGLVFGRIERDVRITVPPDAQVEIASAAGVVANGLRGKLVARLDDGAVRISNHRGDVDVTTSSGDIDVLDAQGGVFALRTDDGALKLTSSGADHLDARTGSGAITAIGLRAVDGALQTDDGRIDVNFAPESDATVNLHADDGHINGARVTAPDGDSASGRSMRLGSGRGQFTISTDRGSIAVAHGASV